MISFPILTAAQMQTCDHHAIHTLGIPSRTLMECAARKAARLLITRTDLFPRGRVLFLCGGGNNGGDGFAMARFLTDGSLPETEKVSVLYAGKLTPDGSPDPHRMSEACERQYRMAVKAGVPVLPLSAVDTALVGATAVVDALLGIGLDRPVTGELASLLTLVAESGLPVLAVDIPTGIHADTGAVMGRALPASMTVTMQALKAGLLLYPGAELCGEIAVADLGIPLTPTEKPYAALADEALLRRVLPPRRRRSHKGTYGRVALLCGSAGMSGAAVLAAGAALRSGVGLVEVLTPEENRPILQAAVPEAIVTVYGEALLPTAAVRAANGLVAGCGLGTSTAARRALRDVLNAIPADGTVPVVLDADGLNLLAGDPTLWETACLSSPQKRVVITPHPAEMARLCGVEVSAILTDLPRIASEFARKRGVTVVLKDAHTVIASPDGDLFLCAAGNAGLAKGGSGDVLAGVIGALLTQNRTRLGDDLTVAQVAAAGVYLHAAAGDAVARRLGEYGMTATDVIEQIPLMCLNFSDSRTRIEFV